MIDTVGLGGVLDQNGRDLGSNLHTVMKNGEMPCMRTSASSGMVVNYSNNSLLPSVSLDGRVLLLSGNAGGGDFC